MIAYQGYVFLIFGIAVMLGLYLVSKAILTLQNQPSTPQKSEPQATKKPDETPQFDPALLLSKSGKPLAGAALQNRIEALARRQREGKPLVSE